MKESVGGTPEKHLWRSSYDHLRVQGGGTAFGRGLLDAFGGEAGRYRIDLDAFGFEIDSESHGNGVAR